MAMLLPVARQQYCDGNGMPLSGGSVTFATPNTGGTVLRGIWADEAETVPLINPTPLDASGITYSGGSQVSVWGFGQYEEFVRDSNGNLIYSAILDTPGGLQGGTIQGSVQINGDLSVVGNITDTQSLSTPNINGTNASFGGNVGVGGQLSAGTVVANQLTSNGNLNVAGSEGIVGNSTIDGTLNAGAIQTPVLNATNITAGNITTSTLTVLTQPGVPGFRGGQGSTDGGGNLNVTFSPPFNNALSLVATLIGDDYRAIPVITALSASGGTIFAAFNADGSGVAGQGLMWVACGT